MVRTAIQGGWVIGWGPSGHQAMEGGVVVIEDDRIAFVGFPDDPDCPTADRTLDAKGKIVSPGLVNLHCIANLDLQVLGIDQARGAGYNRPPSLLDLDPDQAHVFSDADFRTSAEFCVAALLKAGNTSFGAVTTGSTKLWEDPSQEPYALAEAAERMGARAWLSHIYMEGCDYTDSDGTRHTRWDPAKAQAGMDRAIDFIKHLRGRANGRLSGFLFPYRSEKCSDDLLKETMRQSKLLGDVHVRSHFSQHVDEFEDSRARTGVSMAEWLDGIGFLGPQVTLVHALYVAGHSRTGDPPGRDLELLAGSGTSVCHCPVVYARGGVTLESFSRYVAAGVNMGLGCDTFPPDLLEEMRVGSMVNKVVERDRLAGLMRDFYNAATVGGARALGRDDLGRLAPGCVADISIFNLPPLTAGPIDDPLRSLIHFCNRHNCDTVLVDGNVVVEGGRVVGVDEEELGARTQDAWLRYKQGIVDRDHANRSSEEMFPPLLPVLRR